MVKTYILDTNILLKSPLAIFGFEDNIVGITQVTVEELDNKKKPPKQPNVNYDSEVAYNARKTVNIIKELQKKGNITEGIPLKNGGIFKIIGLDASDENYMPKTWNKDKADNVILSTIMDYKEKTNEKCILVSNDGVMQIKAGCLGLEVQDYQNDRISDSQKIYNGRSVFYVTGNIIDKCYKKDIITKEDISPVYECMENEDGEVMYPESDFNMLYDNEFVTLKSLEDSKSILLKYRNGVFKQLEYYNSIENVSPLNTGQKFALEALLAPAEEIPLVFLHGAAGTAKTFLSIVAGIDCVLGKCQYKRVLLCRPNSTFDEGIGYLPGSEGAKIDPLMRPFHDNLETYLEMNGTAFGDIDDIIESYFLDGYVKAEAMAYMRGRSIHNTFIIVDEAQNATPGQIKGMITRAGQGSKIVITGDPAQIDNVKLDPRNNGLIVASEKMKVSEKCATIGFLESECRRSELAKIASELL